MAEEKPVPENESARQGGFAGAYLSQAFAGLGLGLLLGVIMGMTTSGTVQTMLGTLSAVMTGFLGFDKKPEKAPVKAYDAYYRTAMTTMSGIRAGSFGLAVFGGLMLGVFIRAQQSFSLTPGERLARWVEAGYDTVSARNLVAYEMLGLDPQTGEAPATEEDVPQVVKANSSNLFGADASKSYCDEYDPDRYADGAALMDAYKQEEEPAFDPLMAAIEKGVPAGKQMAFLAIVQSIVCDIEKGKAPADLCQQTDPAPRNGNVMALIMGDYRQETEYEKLREISYIVQDEMKNKGKPDAEILALFEGLHLFFCKHVELQAERDAS